MAVIAAASYLEGLHCFRIFFLMLSLAVSFFELSNLSALYAESWRKCATKEPGCGQPFSYDPKKFLVPYFFCVGGYLMLWVLHVHFVYYGW
ncbi:hypothetical protein QR680_013850 [Steinernema hermaphroditum]|uniref:Uncharacterized protein n=1 Tax=Steinernema hermaphroditum TaxID=289476 RepID=A0AA39I967_9BILA|nr:hypothetical protein QR680_013850 [Steinernema hermaphroditum]